jgi:hypothetical protein
LGSIIELDNKEVEPQLLTPSGVEIEPENPTQDMVLGGLDDLNRELVVEVVLPVVTLPRMEDHHRWLCGLEAETLEGEP